MAAIAISWTDITATELRAAATRTDDPDVARRALAIAMSMDDHSRAMAAALCGMDRQTLCDWIHRFNAEGLDGLSDRPRPGRPPLLTVAQQKEVEAWVEAGPSLEANGVVRWRRRDLSEQIAECFGVTLNVRTVGKLLRKLDFRRVSVHPQHPQSDDAAQEEYKKVRRTGCRGRSPTWPRQGSRDLVAGRSGARDARQSGPARHVDQDLGKARHAPARGRDHRFASAYLFGAICPARGTGAAVIMPHVNIHAMNEHLAEISRCVSLGAIALLVLDGAGWHTSTNLTVPDNIVRNGSSPPGWRQVGCRVEMLLT
jgi:transposase